MHFGTYLRPGRYGKIKGTCIFLTRNRNISIRQLSTNKFLEFLFTMCIILDQSSSNARCILIIEKTAGKLKKFISILLNELQWPVRREFFTSQSPMTGGYFILVCLRAWIKFPSRYVKISDARTFTWSKSSSRLSRGTQFNVICNKGQHDRYIRKSVFFFFILNNSAFNTILPWTCLLALTCSWQWSSFNWLTVK